MFVEFHWWYFLAGILLCLGEVFFLLFFLLPMGLAAIFTGILSFFIFSYYWHVFYFVLFSVILFFLISRWKKSKFLKPVDHNVALGLIGQVGIIVEAFESIQKTGKVKIFSDVWDIYYEKKDENMLSSLKMGERVKIVEIHGNKVSVKKV
jgi:membrane protein implicated in regulation of membrane protease activity